MGQGTPPPRPLRGSRASSPPLHLLPAMGWPADSAPGAALSNQHLGQTELRAAAPPPQECSGIPGGAGRACARVGRSRWAPSSATLAPGAGVQGPTSVQARGQPAGVPAHSLASESEVMGLGTLREPGDLGQGLCKPRFPHLSSGEEVTVLGGPDKECRSRASTSPPP